MEKYLDSCTGLPLVPSNHGEKCPGNGDDPELECCCDECDFYLICFPDWENTFPPPV